MSDFALSFRATAGFVTDAVGTYVIGADSYPTTRGGFTFGWVDGTDGFDRTSNDRDSGVSDKRFAGQNQVVPSSVLKFRVDLPATGNYDVRWANGDTGFDFSPYEQRWRVFDNVTQMLDHSKITGPAQDHYYDATGVDRTEAAWPGSNAATTITFASTTFILQFGNPTDADYQVIAHLQITSAGGVALVNRSLQCETGVYRSFG